MSVDRAPETLDPSQRAPFQAYAERLNAARAEAAALDRRSALFAHLRVVAFVVAAGAAGLVLFDKLPDWRWLIAGGGLAGYMLLAVRHDRVIRAEQRAQVRAQLNERGLARLTGAWHAFPNRGERYADPAHLYTGDLDVFGQGSLFQLLDETGTRLGEARLADWLSAPAAREEIHSRQGAVAELAPLLDFRQALVCEGRLAAKAKADPARFIDWAEGPDLLRPIRWAKALPFLLPPATLALYLLGQYGLVPSTLFWAGVSLQVLAVVLTRKTLGRLYERVSMGEAGFVRFEDTFSTLEGQAFMHPRLQALRSGLSADGPPVSVRLRRFSRLFAFAELRQSGQIYAVVNLLLLWDLLWFFRLERWRHENGPKVRAWFSGLAEVEALASIAGYAHDHPHHAVPELVAEGPRFEARALGHPLLDRPVRNDVSLPGPARALIVTGSNMSGKTTLLRAMGLNAVMALAGMPVCAQALTLSVLRVLTSMRVKDSLERGVSYFYAEVQRMKAVLDAAREAQGQALFLLDEALLGTNARERQIASRELLRLLLSTGASGAVTTHDLSLTRLEAEPNLKVQNVHFRDLLEDGKMTFDYRLRPGVVETTNALKVLRMAGIELSDESA